MTTSNQHTFDNNMLIIGNITTIFASTDPSILPVNNDLPANTLSFNNFYTTPHIAHELMHHLGNRLAIAVSYENNQILGFQSASVEQAILPASSDSFSRCISFYLQIKESIPLQVLEATTLQEILPLLQLYSEAELQDALTEALQTRH